MGGSFDNTPVSNSSEDSSVEKGLDHAAEIWAQVLLAQIVEKLNKNKKKKTYEKGQCQDKQHR